MRKIGTVLYLTSAMFVLSAGASQAQTANPAETKEKDNQNDREKPDIVVTGSRIAGRNVFNSPSAIDVIKADTAALQGQPTVAAMLQNATAAASSSQVTGSNTSAGVSIVGGRGINTLSLRGLGTARTLILVDGHRVGPSGINGNVGPVDLSSIPNSMVERVEILKDGASSIYGSEAVAGVVNIITNQNYTGGSLKATVSLPQHGGGETKDVSFRQGFDTGRFYAKIGLELYDQRSITAGERDWASCPQQQVYYADGTRADYIDAKTGTYRCNTFASGYFTTSSKSYVIDPTAVKGGNYGYDLAGLHQVNITYPTTIPDYVALSRQSKAEVPASSPRFLARSLVPSLNNKSAMLSGGLRLDNETTIYFDALFNRRESSNTGFAVIQPTVAATNPNNIAVAGNPYGLAAASTVPIIGLVRTTNQQVDYYRGMLGIRGKLPSALGNWKYDIDGQISVSKGTYGTPFTYNDRLLATSGAGTVCNTALLTTATSCPAGGVQWFRPETLANGQFSAEEAAFLFGYEEGHTTYTQAYVEGNFSGNLFSMPAGIASSAVGFQIRNEFINDTPGPQALARNYYSTSTSGITRGRDLISEAYGEIMLPLFKDAPFAKRLDLDVSGRFSHYNSYGSSATYKIGLNWTMHDIVRLRGSIGTSFRAPGLYERFLANTTSSSAQSAIDPCYQIILGTLSDYTNTLATNCAAAGITSAYRGGSSAVITAGGNGNALKAETSINKTVGIVLKPPVAEMQLSVDFFATDVRDGIQQFGTANILTECYNSANLSSPFCSLVTRATTATGTYVAGNITQVNNNYVNVARDEQRGFDINFSVAHNFPFGRVSLTSTNTIMTKWRTTLINGASDINQLDRIGNPRFNGKVFLTWQKGDYTLAYTGNYTGSTSNYNYYGTNVTNNYGYTGISVYSVSSTPFYFLHTVSLKKDFQNWSLSGTVRNLLDTTPPIVGSAYATRIGNAALGSQFDYYGRTFILTAQRRW